MTGRPLRDRVGSLLFVGIEGTDPDPGLEAFLDEVRPGGIILFRRNVVDENQTGRLIRWLHGGAELPRLLGVDQEGGRVERLRPLLGPLPTAAALAGGGERGVREYGRLLGGALRALGFHVNFAPVLDLSLPGAPNGIGDRSFGDDPGEVGRLGMAYLGGLAEAGVLGCAKHFPGLGPTAVDSHESLPRSDKQEGRFRREDLAPFRRVGDAAAMTMIGHGHYPFLDPRPTPASGSARAIRGLLRGELGYRGVAIADDLEMGAVDQGDGWLDASVAAVSAGCDMVLVCRSRERIVRLRDELMRRAGRGDLAAERLDEAVGRVEALRRRAAHPHPADEFAARRDRLRQRFGLPAPAEGESGAG